MLTKRVEDALNAQLNAESFSGYLYLSMSAWLATRNFNGFSHWMHIQAMEELTHAKKFYDFILQRGGTVRLGRIEAPQGKWADVEAVFADALAHEETISSRINDLVDVALAERDHATHIFLQWFVTEQVEEEENVGNTLNQVRQLGRTDGGLFMLDRELGGRTLPADAEPAP